MAAHSRAALSARLRWRTPIWRPMRALFEHLSQQYQNSGEAEHGNQAAEMEELSG
jgi:hypothetical protein